MESPEIPVRFSLLLAGLEIWILSFVGAIGWLFQRDRWKLLVTPFVTTLLVATFLIAFEFSYMYNMGLLVRQRLQILPAVLCLAVLPYLIETGKTQIKVRLFTLTSGRAVTRQEDD